MNVPGFTAESSVYKTRAIYHGTYRNPQNDGFGVAAQEFLDCWSMCNLKATICSGGCIASGGWLAPFCLIGCAIANYSCTSDCNSNENGHTPPSCSTRYCPPLGEQDCCHPDYHCCEGHCYPDYMDCP